MTARLRQILIRRGGTLLSPDYLNNLTKLRYRCAEGHEWEAVPASLFIGRWCPICAWRKRTSTRRLPPARRLRAHAWKTGDQLLAHGNVGAHTPIELRCPRGHVWRTLQQGFENGTRCPQCRREDLLASLRTLAERWGGACLAESVENGKQPVRWRCVQGHEFVAPGERIRRGGWCLRCRALPMGDLARMQRIARARGGVCLSSEYRGALTKLNWRCGEGHEWGAEPGAIVQGTWCPVCRRRGGYSRRRLTIGLMHETARQRGGACLSSEYHGNKVHLRWRCARGHTWESLPSRVRQGDWCPVCSHSVRGTLEGMRALAIEQGARCVSTSWDNHREPLLFECARRHRFHLNAKVAKSGVWCPTCAGRQ